MDTFNETFPASMRGSPGVADNAPAVQASSLCTRGGAHLGPLDRRDSQLLPAPAGMVPFSCS